MPELVAEEESEDEDEEEVQPKSRREQIIAEVCSLNRRESESFSYIRGKVVSRLAATVIYRYIIWEIF